jgi:hypothetical protein
MAHRPNPATCLVFNWGEIHTVYIIGKAVATSLEVIPVDFYVDDDDVEDLDDDFDEDAIFANEDEPEIKVVNKSVETESSDEDKEDKEETEEVNLEEVE